MKLMTLVSGLLAATGLPTSALAQNGTTPPVGQQQQQERHEHQAAPASPLQGSTAPRPQAQGECDCCEMMMQMMQMMHQMHGAQRSQGKPASPDKR